MKAFVLALLILLAVCVSGDKRKKGQGFDFGTELDEDFLGQLLDNVDENGLLSKIQIKSYEEIIKKILEQFLTQVVAAKKTQNHQLGQPNQDGNTPAIGEDKLNNFLQAIFQDQNLNLKKLITNNQLGNLPQEFQQMNLADALSSDQKNVQDLASSIFEYYQDQNQLDGKMSSNQRLKKLKQTYNFIKQMFEKEGGSDVADTADDLQTEFSNFDGTDILKSLLQDGDASDQVMDLFDSDEIDLNSIVSKIFNSNKIKSQMSKISKKDVENMVNQLKDLQNINIFGNNEKNEGDNNDIKPDNFQARPGDVPSEHPTQERKPHPGLILLIVVVVLMTVYFGYRKFKIWKLNRNVEKQMLSNQQFHMINQV